MIAVILELYAESDTIGMTDFIGFTLSYFPMQCCLQTLLFFGNFRSV